MFSIIKLTSRLQVLLVTAGLVQDQAPTFAAVMGTVGVCIAVSPNLATPRTMSDALPGYIPHPHRHLGGPRTRAGARLRPQLARRPCRRAVLRSAKAGHRDAMHGRAAHAR